jgi:hypothetical protein
LRHQAQQQRERDERKATVHSSFCQFDP